MVADRSTDGVEPDSLLAAIEQSASAAPATVAIVCGSDALTYNELNRRSNQLARTLMRAGITTESIVGLEAVPSADVFVGLLAILKAGGAYLPIDPALPRAHLEAILQESAPAAVLGVGSAGAAYGSRPDGPHWIDVSDPAWRGEDDAPVPGRAHPSALAYVMFTSGSTGPPKGVCIEHRALASFARSVTRAIDFRPGTTILALTTLAFDISILETLVPLSRGMTVRVATADQCADITEVRRLLAAGDIDMIQLTPSRLRLLLSDGAGLASLGCLRSVLVGGEAFPDDLFARLRGCPFNVYNLYGPTETTVYSCVQQLREGEPVTIGVPLDNTRVYIADDKGEPSAPGQPGELLIAGDGLARGYLNNPGLTAERFAPTRFAPCERAYRTGDRVRRTGGRLEYLGRIDRPIKVRGYKVDLDGIEALLRAHPLVSDAVVTIRTGPEGVEQLCAYFVACDPAVDAADLLRAHLSERLPAYSVPAFFMPLASIPLTRNGKVDAHALPTPSAGRRSGAEPTSALERRVREVCADVLGIAPETIGIDESFFGLGGTSLSAGMLLGRLHRELDVDVPLRAFFDAPTTAGLAARIASADRSPIVALPPADPAELVPLSSEQARVYFLQRMAPESLAYNLPEIRRIDGELVASRLESALRSLIARHESLRTSFHEIHGTPVQRVHRQVPFTLAVHDIDEQRAPKRLETLIARFDLERAPLLRAALLRTGNAHSTLLLDVHHLVADGLSKDILIRELCALYRGESLPPAGAQYRDYVAWQQKAAGSADRARQRDYWLRMHSTRYRPCNLPTDRPRPVHRRFAGARVPFNIDANAVKQIRGIAASERASLFMAVFALTSAYLARITSQNETVLGIPVAGRPHATLASAVGMFAGTLAIRVPVDPTASFRHHLRGVRALLLSAFENQDYQFDDLVAQLDLVREPGRNPLFDVMLAVEETEREPLRIPGVEEVLVELDHDTSKVDLTFGMRHVSGGLQGYLEYDTDLFDATTAGLIRAGFGAFVRSVCDAQPVSLQSMG